MVNPDEIFEVLHAVDWSAKRPTLKRDLEIGEHTWDEGTLVTCVAHGGKKLRPRRGKNVDEMRKAMQECLQEEQPAWIGLRTPSPPMPWCCIVRCPCLTLLLTFLLIFGVIAVGVLSAPLSLNTSFDSFMQSDSAASSNYNSFLEILANERGKKRRRLQEALDSEDGGDPSGSPPIEELDSIHHIDLRSILRDLAERPWRFLKHTVAGEAEGSHEESLGLVYEDGSPVTSGRRLQSGAKLYKTFSLKLTYRRKDDQNLLGTGDLTYIRDVEEQVKAIEGFKILCSDSSPTYKFHCTKGVSMANLVFPEPVPKGADTQLYLNGSGKSSIPISVAVSLAQRDGLTSAIWPARYAQADQVKIVGVSQCGDEAPECRRWKAEGQCHIDATYAAYMQDFCKETCGVCDKAVPTSEGASSNTSTEQVPEITLLRTYITFQAFCCIAGQSGQSAKVSKLNGLWDGAVPQMVDMLNAKNKQGNVRVFFAGNGISTYEIMAAVGTDGTYALMSYVFVFLYAMIHTRSVVLSFCGLFLVMLSIPVALAVFMMASGSGEMSLMMCLSVFIVIGVGSDMMFVYTDFYKQSLEYSRDRVERIKYTYMQAATSTAATTFTTTMSFLANLASVLRPLREFGFFMGVCTTSAWLIVLLAYPALLIISERIHTRVRAILTSSPEEVKHAGGRFSGESRRQSTFAKARKTASRTTTKMIVDALDPEKKGAGLASNGKFLGKLCDLMHRCKYVIVLIFLAFTAVQLYLATQNIRQAVGIPQTFPDDHNQQAGTAIEGNFTPYKPLEYNTGSYTTFVNKCSDLLRSCELHKCTSYGKRRGNLSSCECFPHLSKMPQSSLSGGCTQYKVMTRVIGRDGLELEHFKTSDLEQHLRERWPGAEVKTQSNRGSSVLEMLHWDSGDQYLASMLQVPDALVGSDTGAAPCSFTQLCYCGLQPCEGSDVGRPFGRLRLDAAAKVLEDRRLNEVLEPPREGYHLQESRSLSAVERHLRGTPIAGRTVFKVAPDKRQDVSLIFGLVANGTNPLLGVSQATSYQVLDTFRLEDPWAQRRSLEICGTYPEELDATSYICWLAGFKDWWQSEKGEEWPVRPNKDFHAQAYEYANSRMTNSYQTTSFVFFNDERKVKGMYFAVTIDQSTRGGSAKGLEAMARWTKFVDAFNAKAEASVKGVWHTSRLWQSSEAEEVILSSTLTTLIISFSCVFIGVMVFTCSVHLAIIVMTIVIIIVVGLLFFMTIVMDWAIGAIEVLSLIVFVGFAVDYCLHVGHKYHSCHINDVVVEESDEEEQEEVRPRASSRLSRLSRRTSITSGMTRNSPSRLTRRLTVSMSDVPKWDPSLSVKDRENKKKSNRQIMQTNRGAERFERAKYALERIGPSVVGSALTTIGSASFLLPCTVHVFTKLGAVVCGVTVYAVVFALVPLPALLMCIGPCGHDFKSLLSLFSRAAHHFMPEDDDEDDEEEEISAITPVSNNGDNLTESHRRYVLNMPSKGMGACGPSGAPPPTRTKINING